MIVNRSGGINAGMNEINEFKSIDLTAINLFSFMIESTNSSSRYEELIQERY